MSEITLNDAIKTFQHGYLRLRGNDTLADMLPAVPATFVNDLFPLGYARVTDPIFAFIVAGEPGGPLHSPRGWHPHVANFFEWAQHLCYNKDYGSNGGSVPAVVSKVYLNDANMATMPGSYIMQYNKDIKPYVSKSRSVLLDLNQLSEWDTLICYAMETIRLGTIDHVHGGDQPLNAATQRWFEDLLRWTGFIYTWYERQQHTAR